jgi:toxin ParE1/3/4
MSARNLKLVLTPAAQSDLADVLSYTERQWGVSRRMAYDRQFDDAFAQLAQFPELGRSRPEYGLGVRSHRVGQHVVIYEPTEAELLILRLLHMRRDLDAEFS